MSPTASPDALFAPPAHVAPPGLKGLIVADTSVGSVRGNEGYYHYRQYNAVDLARTCSVEQIWHFLLTGSLGTGTATTTGEDILAFTSRVGESRVVERETAALIAQIARRVRPPHLVLQASLGLLLPDAEPTLDLTPREREDDALRLAAAVPTVLAIVQAVRNDPGVADVELPEADPSAAHAADWLRMLTGREIESDAARAVETYLAATIDHGFNASTFATRVVTSTGADVAAALGSGVAALSGPLHGGAPARALAMIEEIGDPERTEDWVRARLAAGNKIMGFGHAVYRAEDPRSRLMHDVATDLVRSRSERELLARAVEIERRILAELNRHRPEAQIVTNVEYYAGVVLHLAGVPAAAFTSCFNVSRVIGWTAHLLEQAANNKIMRPAARYVGPTPQPG